MEVSLFVDIAVLAEHVNAGNPDAVEAQDSIVNTVDSNLDAHIAARDTWHQVHVLIPDGHQECVDTLVLAIDDGLTEDDGHVSVMESVGDPVLLAQISRAVNDKLACSLVIGDRRLHLHRIVAVAELSEAEAADCIQSVDLVEEVVVSTIVQSKARAAKQVHLHSMLDRHGRVDEAHEFVRAEYIVRVGVELLD